MKTASAKLLLAEISLTSLLKLTTIRRYAQHTSIQENPSLELSLPVNTVQPWKQRMINILAASVPRSIVSNFTVSALQKEESVAKSVSVLAVETILTTQLEYIMLNVSPTTATQVISLGCPPMCLQEDARARNLPATKIIASASELVFLVVRNANASIAETESPIITMEK